MSSLASFDRSNPEKPDCDRVLVQIREYHGERYIDIRAHYRTDTADDWRPTRKGISVRARELDGITAFETARTILTHRKTA